MIVVIIDNHGRIDAFFPELDELIAEGLVIADGADDVKYVGGPGPQ